MVERKARMTDRERVEALLQRKKPDRVPIWPFFAVGFFMVHTGTSIADAYNKPAAALEAQRKTAQDFGWVFRPVLGYAGMGGWEFGGDIKWPSGEFAQAPTVTRLPVQSEEEAWNLKPADPKTGGIIPLMMEFNQLASQERLDNEPFNVNPLIRGPFTTAGSICSAERLSKWLIKKPDIVHHLLRMSTDWAMGVAQYFRDTFGLEDVLPVMGDPTTSNDVISPKQFEEFVLPYFQEETERLLAMGYKHIYMHPCGEQNGNLPHWAKVRWGDPGLLIWGHEVELEDAAKYFPNDIMIGNLEPAIIQTKTPDEVYEASRKVIEKGKKLPTGFIFSPGCEMPPKASPENIMAMTRAVNDFGWYD